MGPRRVGGLAPLLSGEAQKAYYDLPPAEDHNYRRLQDKILGRSGLSVTTAGQRFQTWEYQPGVPPRSQMAHLTHLAKQWLQPELLSARRIIEREVMEKFLRTLPYDAKKLVGQHAPGSPTEMVDLVERVENTQQLIQTTPRTPARGRNQPGPYQVFNGPTGFPQRPSAVLERSPGLAG